jgi:hypothetical protein
MEKCFYGEEPAIHYWRIISLKGGNSFSIALCDTHVSVLSSKGQKPEWFQFVQLTEEEFEISKILES